MSEWAAFPSVSQAAPPPAPGAAQTTGWERFQSVAPAPKKEEGGFLSRMVTGAKNLVTGEDRREFDYPDLSSASAPVELSGSWFSPERDAQLQKMQTFNRLGAARTDQGKIDILKKDFPDIAGTAQKDKFGNTYVTLNGQPHYLNRPGASREDLSEAGAGLVATAPLAIATGGMYAGASLPVRMGLSALEAGGGSMVQDVMAQNAGSTEKIDAGTAATSAVAGGLLQTMAPAARAIYQRVVGSQALYDPATGTLTDQGKRILAGAGFKPEEITNDLAREFAAMAKQAANPEDAARMAGAKSLPVPVTPTLGDATRNPSQQMFESLAEKGTYGEAAGGVMRNARAAQQEALQANVPAIQQEIGGGRVSQRGDAGQSVQSALTAQRAGEKAGVDAAYENARQTSASLSGPEAMNRLHTDVAQAGGDLLRFAPKASQLAGDLQALMGRDPSVTELYNWRRAVSQLQQNVSDNTERAALTAMKKQFDKTMDDFSQTGMMVGDEQSVRAWAGAIKARAEFGAKWQSGDILEKLTETVDGGRQLKVAPEAASNLIFRGTSNGFLSQPEAVRSLKKLKESLPEGEWNAIREEAFLRIAQTADGAYQGAERSFSGVNMRKAWDNFQKNNPLMVRLIFNDQERALIGQFTKVAADVTGKVRGGDNFSNTTPAMANIVQRLPFLGKTLQFAAQMPGAKSLLNAGQTVRAVNSANPGVPKVNVPAFAGIGGQVIGPTVEENLP